jgi:hypothetical protein
MEMKPDSQIFISPMIKLCTHELKKKKEEKIATIKPWILLGPWIAKFTFQVG